MIVSGDEAANEIVVGEGAGTETRTCEKIDKATITMNRAEMKEDRSDVKMMTNIVAASLAQTGAMIGATVKTMDVGNAGTTKAIAIKDKEMIVKDNAAPKIAHMKGMTLPINIRTNAMTNQDALRVLLNIRPNLTSSRAKANLLQQILQKSERSENHDLMLERRRRHQDRQLLPPLLCSPSLHPPLRQAPGWATTRSPRRWQKHGSLQWQSL
eukprot:m.126754 g.126754  ORF g.126754 m.126754 type:complete len:212 (-) comp17389_c0_seq1:885-1520(-)